MRNIRYLLLILILFLSVGFAAISTNLGVNSTTAVTMADFDVYFSDVHINGVQDITAVESAKKLTFMLDSSKGNYEVAYDITNNSENYEANVEVNCVSDNENLLILNELDSSTNLLPYETRSGKVTIDSSDWIYEDLDGSGDISIGDLYTLRAYDNEKFNVISWTDDTVTMLAQYNIFEEPEKPEGNISSFFYRQSSSMNEGFVFSSDSSLIFGDDEREIDIQDYDGEVKTSVNEYISFLKEMTGDNTITGTLITFPELGALGCDYPSDYLYQGSSSATCENSPYLDWLLNDQGTWTRSVVPGDYLVWEILSSDNSLRLNAELPAFPAGVRPVITISKNFLDVDPLTCTIDATPVENYMLGEGNVPSSLEKCQWKFNDLDASGTITPGDEYIYCTEAFNVISNTNDNVSLLAKRNLGSNYRQSLTGVYVSFSNNYGWEYKPGPKEINIQSYDGDTKKYLNKYVAYMRIITGYPTITGDLITMSQLGDLGCVVPSDYSYSMDSSTRTCANSPHKDWLIISEYWRTKSAVVGNPTYVWGMLTSGNLTYGAYDGEIPVRPVLTVPIDALNNKIYNPYTVGSEITISGEKFNIISETDDTITMLAKFNLGTDYLQNSTANNLVFSNSRGWENTPGPKEIDIQSYDGNVKTYLNEYLSFLEDRIGENTIDIGLITLSQLGALECIYPSSYEYASDSSGRTCINSSYQEWLFNEQNWWTQSAEPRDQTSVWYVNKSGTLGTDYYYNSRGVRPVITISKSALESYQQDMYKVGSELLIDDEKFNVISSTNNTVTLLSQTSLGAMSIYAPCGLIEDDFCTENFPALDIDFEDERFSLGVKPSLDEYRDLLIENTGDSTTTVTLITLRELKDLGCTGINDDYSLIGDATCENSPYVSWLTEIRPNTWWTRSHNYLGYGVHVVYDNYITDYPPEDYVDVYPVITISKDTYDKYY